VPVAVNCWPVPNGIVGLAGVTAMETNCGGPTIKLVPAEIALIVAAMVAEPTPELTASPREPVLLLATATVAAVLLQVTFVVMSLVV